MNYMQASPALEMFQRFSHKEEEFAVPKPPYRDRILYSPNSATWSGRGDQGKTIDNTISRRKLNKLDW